MNIKRLLLGLLFILILGTVAVVLWHPQSNADPSTPEWIKYKDTRTRTITLSYNGRLRKPSGGSDGLMTFTPVSEPVSWRLVQVQEVDRPFVATPSIAMESSSVKVDLGDFEVVPADPRVMHIVITFDKHALIIPEPEVGQWWQVGLNAKGQLVDFVPHEDFVRTQFPER